MRIFRITAILLTLGFVNFMTDYSALADSASVTKVKSPMNALETLERVEAVIAKRGLKVFNRVDHGTAAQEFGKSMPPSWVVIFGNPKVGTDFMLKSPTSAIDFPLKSLVYEDGDGQVWIAYNTADYMKLIFERHGLSGDMGWYNKLMTSLMDEILKK